MLYTDLFLVLFSPSFFMFFPTYIALLHIDNLCLSYLFPFLSLFQVIDSHRLAITPFFFRFPILCTGFPVRLTSDLKM